MGLPPKRPVPLFYVECAAKSEKRSFWAVRPAVPMSSLGPLVPQEPSWLWYTLWHALGDAGKREDSCVLNVPDTVLLDEEGMPDKWLGSVGGVVVRKRFPVDRTGRKVGDPCGVLAACTRLLPALWSLSIMCGAGSGGTCGRLSARRFPLRRAGAVGSFPLCCNGFKICDCWVGSRKAAHGGCLHLLHWCIAWHD